MAVEVGADVSVGADAAIARTAHQMLSWAVQVPKKAITVTVHGRVLTLSGEVMWQFEREAAARAVTDISGVQSVVNEISSLRGAQRTQD